MATEPGASQAISTPTNHALATDRKPQRDPEVSIVAKSEWTARRIVMGTLTVMGVALVFLLFYRLYMVVFLLFAAIALQVALSPAVEWLHKHRIPRWISVMVLYSILFIGLTAALWFGIPPFIQQTMSVVQDVPNYYQGARDLLIQAPLAPIRWLGLLLPEEFSLPVLMELADTGNNEEEVTPAPTGGVFWVAIRTLFAVLSIFVLAYYWTLEGNTIMRRVVLKVPSQQRVEFRALIDEFTSKIGDYFRGTIYLCVIVGVASTVAYLLIGIPNAILLGVIMMFFEAIPLLGPILGAIPAILVTMAFAPEKLLWVIGALLLIQGLEGNILVPRVMDESVGVNPVVSLLAITAFGALFGVAGALLAIPMAAILQILLARILFKTPVRQDVSAPPSAPESVSRSKVGVLRVETQEIIQDLHKITPTDDGDETPQEIVQAEDRLEALAVDVDIWLAELEERTAANGNSQKPAERSA